MTMSKNISLSWKSLSSLAFLLALSGCTREADIPQPASPQPVFGASLRIGADSLDLYAGKDGYHLSSDYSRDTASVYLLSASLKQKDCTTCTQALTVTLYDDTVRSTNAIPAIGTVLSAGARVFAGKEGSISSASVHFQAQVQGKSYLWDFGDGNISSKSDPTNLYKATGTYNVCLSVNDSVHITQVCNSIVIGDTKGCNIQFSATSTNLAGTFMANPGHQQYIWKFGDASSGETTSNSTVSHTFLSKGVYKVSVTENDNNGCHQGFTKYVAINTLDTAASAYSYQISNKLTVINFRKVLIGWTDKQGRQYSSRRATGSQPSQSFFQVLQSEPYKDDATGHKTYKITASMQACLYNLSNPSDSLLLKSGKVVVAVGYPQ